jgi:hypothetical protein
MKIQDILFLIFFTLLLFKHKENSFISLGLACFLLAIPLFYFWIFFTAERLIWYGGLLILAEVIYKLYKLKHEKN